MPNSKAGADEIRDTVIRTAKDLFFQNGIAATEMKTIAQKAGIGRSTLYRYFPTKAHIAFVIIEEIMDRGFSYSISSIPSNVSGLKKLEAFAYTNIDYYSANSYEFSLIAEFDHLYRGAYPDIPEAKRYCSAMTHNQGIIYDLIRQGQIDGSIRAELDPPLYAAVLTNTILGVSQRVMPRDMHYQQEHGASAKDITLHAVECVLRAMNR